MGRGRWLFAIEVDDGAGFRAATAAEVDAALRQPGAVRRPGHYDRASMPAPAAVEPSYFTHGRVSPAAVEMLFITSAALFAITPWSFAAANQVLRMDIPALGVEGACLSIIGQLGQSRGVLIFSSRDGYEQFLEAAANSDPEQPDHTVGADLLSLTFHNATHLPPAMRREVMRHGWPVESPDAYPLVARRHTPAAGRTGCGNRRRLRAGVIRLPPQARGALQGRHAVCESHIDDDDGEERFTVPCEAFDLFDVTAVRESGT